MIFILIGIVCLCITLFVHRHTYNAETNELLPLTIWEFLLMLIVSLIPIVNIIAFCVGVIAYLMSMFEDQNIECSLGKDSKIKQFLNKKIW